MSAKTIHRCCAACLLAVSLLVSINVAHAQKSDFQKRYELLVSHVGYSGVGVETLIKEWEKVDSTSENVLQAKFDFYFSKSQTEKVVTKSQKKFLGMNPVLSLQDSLGRKVYYFREISYDDELFSKALGTAERLIALYPDELSKYFLKANALVAFEKENPDMAYAFLSDLVTLNQTRTRPWNYNGEKMGADFFPDAMQEYCETFYNVGSEASRKAAFNLSVRLNKLFPDKLNFVHNIALYYLIQEGKPKVALKYYNKLLKKTPDDQAALRNCLVAARQCGDKKLEAKYRGLLAKYGYTK